MKILVVDDDPLSVVLLKEALANRDYDVCVCGNGRMALDYLMSDNTCRMVITDWEMPEMDGIELTRNIRSSVIGRYIYIIIVTSREGTRNIVEGLTAGADDFISKPFHPAELEVRLKSGKRLISLETRNMTIFALAKLAESRDPETGTHLERVRKYSKLLAEYLRNEDTYKGLIDNKFVELMYLTSPLHDIGKVAIPDYVLLKPGRLDDNEFEIMKSHTTEGACHPGFCIANATGCRFSSYCPGYRGLSP